MEKRSVGMTITGLKLILRNGPRLARKSQSVYPEMASFKTK